MRKVFDGRGCRISVNAEEATISQGPRIAATVPVTDLVRFADWYTYVKGAEAKDGDPS
jgi:hypothetical protein